MGLKIVVPGGAGDMGSLTVEDLAKAPDVELVTIADYNTTAAERVRARLDGVGSARIEVRQVDANDHQALTDALRGHDVAASALGPFYKYEPLLVRAAIDAGVNYASICDDWIACERVLDELDAPARAAGVVAITGIGASPGITNLLAVHLASLMDSVERIDVSCFQPWNAGGGEAVLRHLLFIVSGEIAAFSGGRASRTAACSQEQFFDMPHYGRRKLWNLGHAEPVSLPRHFKELDTCNFFMGLGTGMGLLVALARRGWFKSEKNVDRVMRVLAPFERWIAGATPGLSAIRVDVWGKHKGAEAHEMACGTGLMRDCTGHALAVGALVLARGQATTSHGGVYAPEASLPLIPMLEGMRALGVRGFKDLAMTREITEADAVVA